MPSRKDHLELRRKLIEYETLFGTLDAGYAITDIVRDEEGRVVDLFGVNFNRSYTHHSGLPAFAGQRASEVIKVEPEWLRQFAEVARTGVPARYENYIAERDRWVSTHYSLVGDLGSERVAVVFDDITERKRAEIALRESEERQSFLLRFSDELRAGADADAVANRAIRMLMEKMQLDRCYITVYRPKDDEADFPYQVGNDSVPPLPPKVRLSDFPDAYEQVLDHTYVIEDDVERLGLTDAERANSDSLGMRAMLASTIRKGARNPLCSLVAVSSDSRRWSAGEIALVEEVAERTWAAMERVKAEQALRESEERFSQFANASAAGLWVRDAATMEMEFASPVLGGIYGVDTEALGDGVEHWARLVVPDDRAAALEHLESARRGEIAAHEFRIQRPSDGAFRWVRDTAFALQASGQVVRIGGIAEEITENRQLVEHQGVLLSELQHRVRNIMGMIRSVANRTAEGASDAEGYRELLEGRLLALARVQALLMRHANTGGSLRSIVREELAAQAHQSSQIELIGPDVMLSPKAVEVLTLAFHELATNALKYGALSSAEGSVTVSWSLFQKRGASWLAIDWREEGAPVRAPSSRVGFGSELIEARIPYELRGMGKLTIDAGGAQCHMEFPLIDGESILETDAPQPTSAFGGSLDMTGAPDLTGRTVLVVEDDYYMAQDTVSALSGAGATVLGPCPSESATLDLLEVAKPTLAVVDLNLGGGGPKFAIAHELKRRGVPFVFLTGYDPDVVPPDLADVPRLQKPIPFRAIVEALANI